MACPVCRFSNEPGERFCGGGGASLRSSPTVSQPTFSTPGSYTPKHLAERIPTSSVRLGRVIVVADRGMVSAQALALLEESPDAPFEVIVGGKLWKPKEIS